jgi:hypothetical protein
MRTRSYRCAMFIAELFLAVASHSWSSAAKAKPAAQKPNILFFVLDDVGIDQMSVFGYGGATAPRVPNVEAIANSGVRFRNFWTKPEDSHWGLSQFPCG